MQTISITAEAKHFAWSESSPNAVHKPFYVCVYNDHSFYIGPLDLVETIVGREGDHLLVQSRLSLSYKFKPTGEDVRTGVQGFIIVLISVALEVILSI